MKIKAIEIKRLYQHIDVYWELNNDVNILTGINGSGKSTILQLIVEALGAKNEDIDFHKFDVLDEMIILFDNNILLKINSTRREIIGTEVKTDFNINIDFTNTFDIPHGNYDTSLSVLDAQLKDLIRLFTIYQRDIKSKEFDVFIDGEVLQEIGINKHKEITQQIQNIRADKNLFIKYINELFGETNKGFDEKDLNFKIKGKQEPIELKKLSSGEKQVLIILLKTLLQERKPFIYLLDEPEISLHIKWQRQLINYIEQLNPNAQIIVATHSATLFYLTYENKRFAIDSIINKTSSNSVSKILKTNHSTKLINHLKKEIAEIKDTKKDSLAQTYNTNLALNRLTVISKNAAQKVIDLYKEANIEPDVITVTTLISKIITINDAIIFLNNVVNEYNIKPNQYTLNVLIKKVNTVDEGIELLSSIRENFDVYPDIITFSTLLGKVMKTEDINSVEEARNYYGIQDNERYLRKLKVKR